MWTSDLQQEVLEQFAEFPRGFWDDLRDGCRIIERNGLQRGNPHGTDAKPTMGFPSIRRAALSLGLSRRALTRGEVKPSGKSGGWNAKPITINGVEYKSGRAARKALGLSWRKVR